MRAEKLLDGRVLLYNADCMDAMATLKDNSIDSCVCDPPYHLSSIVKRFGAKNAAPAKKGKTGAYARQSRGFMGKVWDGGDVAFRPETWAEVLRVLKPGAYVIAFSSSRTFGRMSVAIEDAGFITHPLIGWIFGQGFPKAHKVHLEGHEGWCYGAQSLKPALEPIYMGQKPFSEINGSKNVERWSTGAVNIDGCRVTAAGPSPAIDRRETARRTGKSPGRPRTYGTTIVNRISDKTYMAHHPGEQDGRWPANVVHDGSAEVLAEFPQSESQRSIVTSTPGSINGAGGGLPSHTGECGFDDSGSVARFFYAAKADGDDRSGSRHPTVKPLDLIQWLVRMVTPPKGLVLDLFAGTGVTGEAAWREGMSAVLIEREAEYCADIRRRMKLALAGPDERAREIVKASGKADMDPGPLFGWLAS